MKVIEVTRTNMIEENKVYLLQVKNSGEAHWFFVKEIKGNMVEGISLISDFRTLRINNEDIMQYIKPFRFHINDILVVPVETVVEWIGEKKAWRKGDLFRDGVNKDE